MPTFDSHLTQAKKNLDFLSKVDSIPEFWDWKVTISFYVAVHLVNSHIAKITGSTFRTHEQVYQALNPKSNRPTKISLDPFFAYEKLKMYSRQSRYLIEDKASKHTQVAKLTYSVHYKKSIHHLNTLLEYFARNYNIEFSKMTITCPELKAGSLTYFSPS